MKQQVTKEGYVDFHLNQAKTYMEETEALAYKLIGAEDMELSTQIIWKDAIARGIKVDVLDRAENFLRFQKRRPCGVCKTSEQNIQRQLRFRFNDGK